MMLRSARVVRLVSGAALLLAGCSDGGAGKKPDASAQKLDAAVQKTEGAAQKDSVAAIDVSEVTDGQNADAPGQPVDSAVPADSAVSVEQPKAMSSLGIITPVCASRATRCSAGAPVTSA